MVLVFLDGGKYSEAFLAILAHPYIGKDTWAKVAYAKVAFRKDDERARVWNVKKAPTLVILDPTGEKPEVLRSLRGGSAQSVKAALLSALRRMKR